MKKYNYFSTDIESDGPCPGLNSMLSYASVVFNENGEEIANYSDNLFTLPDAVVDPKTKEFWDNNPKAYEETRKNLQVPRLSMQRYVLWVKQFTNPIFVAYPSGFDFTFIYWYTLTFTGECPFGFSALDIKSYASAKLNTNFKQTVKKNFPKEWKTGLPKHTHKAIDDAREQGLMFFRMKDYVCK